MRERERERERERKRARERERGPAPSQICHLNRTTDMRMIVFPFAFKSRPIVWLVECTVDDDDDGVVVVVVE